MDLSGYNGCQGGVFDPKKVDNSGTNKVHANHNSAWDEIESRANEYAFQTQKTEISEKNSSPLIGDTFAEMPGKTAIDLSFCASGNNSSKTIFDDADYFARNCMYKLMPITFEAVNERIIHIEHNYCNFGSSGDGPAVEGLNKMLSNRADERNYKKRKSAADVEVGEGSEEASVNVREGLLASSKLDEDRPAPIKPLDLSLSVFHEQKTDKMLKENQSNIPKTRAESRSTPDRKQYDLCESNKENVTTSRKIEVTISRPGQQEYYQPCEVFLNDVARISPDLIKNDCYEIDIIDRTGQDLQREKCRMYYIVSESTWQTFENSTERIILTNDLNIGEPIPCEKLEKPTYLIFDQNSLTESLVKICENKGGRFEYTCVKQSRREVEDCESATDKATLPEESTADAGEGLVAETSGRSVSPCEKRNIETEPQSVFDPLTAGERVEETEAAWGDCAAKGEASEPQATADDNMVNEKVDVSEVEPEAQRSASEILKNGTVSSKRRTGDERSTRKSSEIRGEVNVRKRVTRSGRSLTVGVTNRSEGSAKTTAAKTERKTIRAETKSRETVKASSCGEKRKMGIDGGVTENMRVTRATAKRKAMENRRMTRGRRQARNEPERKVKGKK